MSQSGNQKTRGLIRHRALAPSVSNYEVRLSDCLPKHKGRALSDTPSLVLFRSRLRDLSVFQQPRRQEMLDRLLLLLQGAAELH
jgi:hypothetical protein